MKKVYYYVLEDMDGEARYSVAKRKLARGYMTGCGVCYKKMVGNPKYKKFCFMWYN